MLASVKMGMIVADISPDISNVSEVREALKLADCKAIFFSPVSSTQDNLLLLRKSIPELYECNYNDFR
jgi:hypothetical protein